MNLVARYQMNINVRLLGKSLLPSF
jgi:hypothetical protein